MRLFTGFIPLVLVVSACGGLDPSDRFGTSSGQSDRSEVLLFTAADVAFSSGQMFRYDFEPAEAAKGTVSKPMLTGSGDMVLFESEGRVFLFNRRAQDLNFRQLTLSARDEGFEWSMGPQLLTPVALAGDPHDVLVLDDETMMLANYVKGVLVVANFKTGAIKQVLRMPERYLRKGPFRPESLVRVSENSVGVLHQGYDENYLLNLTQSALLFERAADGNWEFAKHIPLATNVPQGLFATEGEQFQTIGLCYHGVSDCKGGVEVIDFESGKSDMAVTFDNEKLTYYGAPRPLPNGKFVMSAQHHSGDEVKTQLTMLDPSTEKVSGLYTYPSDPFAGYWGYQPSRSGEVVFFGDPAKGGKGELFVFGMDQQKVLTSFKTDLIPYSMITVSPADVRD